MCLICGEISEKTLCVHCASQELVEGICKSIVFGANKDNRIDTYIENFSSAGNRLLALLNLSDEFPEYDLSFYRICAFSRLGTKYTSALIREATLYINTNEKSSKAVSVIKAIATGYIHTYDFDKAIEMCDLVINKYNDKLAYYIKAEALLKMWQINDAIDCLIVALAHIKRESENGMRSTKSYERIISNINKRLDDYKQKRKSGYFYFPDSIEARKKLSAILVKNGIGWAAKMLICDDSMQNDSFVAVDLEYTYQNGTEKIIEIGAVKVINGQINDRFSQLVNPHAKVSKRVKSLTGISNDMLVGKPDINKVFRRFISFCGDLPLLAHDASVDIRLLMQEAVKNNMIINSTTIDTLLIAKKLWPQQKKYGLQYLAEQFGIDQEIAHRAFCDAETTAKLYLLMRKSS